MSLTPRNQDIAVQLRDLLAKERAVVLTGDYMQLEEIAQRKIELVETLAQNRPDPALADDMRHALAQSAALLKAARDGFRIGIETVTGTTAVTTALYRADGSRRIMQDAARQMEHKA